MIGKGHSGALVTFVERKTSFTVSTRTHYKSARTMTAATISLLNPFKEAVHTITADNGKEFAYHDQMTATLGAAVYFADPYSSWQRGLNEKTNGLLRPYWPKSTDFKKFRKMMSQRLSLISMIDREKTGLQNARKINGGRYGCNRSLGGYALRG